MGCLRWYRAGRGGTRRCGAAWRGRVAVLRGTGVQSEAELPFAGVHLLLGSVLDRRARLPRPQREALEAAFGLRRAGPRDRFLVGLAVGSPLAELAEGGPLACLVDDAQWLDRASAQALVFAARRLGAEPIAIIFTARDHDAPFPAAGLPELRLGGLTVRPRYVADSAQVLPRRVASHAGRKTRGEHARHRHSGNRPAVRRHALDAARVGPRAAGAATDA